MTTKTIIPFKATHPGLVLNDELLSREITQKEFAHDIDMQPSMLNEIIKGKRAITAEIALMLEKILDIPADFWLNFQSQYELDQVRIKEKFIQKAKQIETWKAIKQYVPVSIFIKRGYLNKSLNDDICKVWDIYGVTSVEKLKESFASHSILAHYKKSEKLLNDHINIFAWSKLAQWESKKEIVDHFQPQNKEQIVKELNALFCRNTNVIFETKRLLNKSGIKFLIIEKFKQSPIDGYSFWRDDNPSIVLTQRKKNLDNFAFTVMHELGHVFEHLAPNHTEDFLDIDDPTNERNGKEIEADKFAMKCFMDEDLWRTFLNQNQKFDYRFTEKKIYEFANKSGIHPRIVFGMYCYDTKQFAIKTSIDKTVQ